MTLETVSECLTFGGKLGTYAHDSATNNCRMRFTVFTPEQASAGAVPVLWWLSGLTCTEENFTIKSGAYRAASELGLMIVAPDTSPRGDGVANDEAYDLGQGAGFYVNATQAPWNAHFHMYDYITRDLPEVVLPNFPADPGRQGISGHSMGGHGALTIGLRNPDTYKSISAFAPIVSPMNCPWGEKALTTYLGPDRAAWEAHDACALVRAAGNRSDFPGILMDQGLADDFLDGQLKPHLFEEACKDAAQTLNLRRHEGYDHSYFFVSTFLEDHFTHHLTILKGG